MEVGTKNIEKRPKRHKIVYEVLIVELEILICLFDTLSSFESFTPVEKIAVLLRSDRVMKVLMQYLANYKIGGVKLNTVCCCDFVFTKSNQLEVKNKEIFLSFLLSKPVIKVKKLEP